jgi:hypothetical protein
MSEQVMGTIELLQSQIQKQEQEIAEKKRVINTLCPLAGIPAIYAEIESASTVSGAIRADEFYGQPLQSVVRSVLEKRKRANLGPATVKDIYLAMKAGGYQFSAKNDDYAMRGLYQSLTKNSGTFHKLPNGQYGLLAWYPTAKAAKSKGASVAESEGIDEDAEALSPENGLPEDGDIAEEQLETAHAAGGDQKEKPSKPR